ncbi:MAG TPA: hypothetical protein VFI92_07100 [Steroidobacteraceae bacterium]|nr:hypothetical protein [Steroidobacteraceae bacterium]
MATIQGHALRPEAGASRQRATGAQGAEHGERETFFPANGFRAQARAVARLTDAGIDGPPA